jgi:hypothetical protein
MERESLPLLIWNQYLIQLRNACQVSIELHRILSNVHTEIGTSRTSPVTLIRTGSAVNLTDNRILRPWQLNLGKLQWRIFEIRDSTEFRFLRRIDVTALLGYDAVQFDSY